MSIKRDYANQTEDRMELEPLDGPKSPEKESKTNGVQFSKQSLILPILLFCLNSYCFLWFQGIFFPSNEYFANQGLLFPVKKKIDRLVMGTMTIVMNK